MRFTTFRIDDPLIAPPPLISNLATAPIYRMKRAIVNFGAASIAALAAISCSNANTAANSTESPVAAEGKKTLNAPDPIVVAADRGRIIGDSTARTWVVIASDFQCPYCKDWHDNSYRQLVNEYVRTGKIRVAYLHFPLNQHRNAVPTANASMCASAQNKFWAYHDGLFASVSRWGQMDNPRPVLDSIARAVGADMTAWSQCYESERMLPLIMADRDRAASGGVQSTPSFLVGGQVIAGAVPFESMRPLIDSAVARDRGGSAPR
jgi:protein-disulfide isomerase